MPSETVKRLLNNHYGSFPKIDDFCYDFARDFSEFLLENGVLTAGVIAIGISKKGFGYIAFSANLNADILIRSYYSTKYEINWRVCSNKVSVDIVSHGNPGCAEKKLLSEIMRAGDKLEKFAIIEHPRSNLSVSSHYAVVDGDIGYISPCQSCCTVATILKKAGYIS